MARELELKRLQLLNRQVEKEKSHNSRDFKEITIAITLLASLSAFLLKTIDYFNNNTVSYYLQSICISIVSLLLFELSVIFLFLMLKGYLVSTQKNGKTEWKDRTDFLFKNIFINPVVWSFILILMLSFDYYTKDFRENVYYKYIFYTISVLIAILYVYLYLYFFNIQKKEIKLSWKACVLVIIIFPILFNIYYIGPTHLLSGYYSIEIFPQSNIYHDEILTFTIKETGITHSKNYISLYKLNVSNNSLEPSIDNITLPIEKVSVNKSMFGGTHELGYYLNINSSNLQSGNYMLHAEVTDDLSKISVFGTLKKHDDKLFYIAPKSTNYSFYPPQELKGNLTQ